MAISHARPGQVVDVAPLGAALAGSTSHAIVKTPSLELMRLVLRRGGRIATHSVSGECTLQCIEGRVTVHLADGPHPLGACQLMLLGPGQPHGVDALEDSSLLVTVQIPPGGPGSASSTAG